MDWTLTTIFNCPISISLQPEDINIWNFKLQLIDLAELGIFELYTRLNLEIQICNERLCHQQDDISSITLGIQRPNLKNLSWGLDLSRGSNMVYSSSIFFNFSRFKPAFDCNRFWGDLRRGLNSLNSDTELLCTSLRYAESIRAWSNQGSANLGSNIDLKFIQIQCN